MNKNHQSTLIISVVISSLLFGFLGGLVSDRFFGEDEFGVLDASKESRSNDQAVHQPDFIAQTTDEQKMVEVVRATVPGVVSVIETKQVPVYERTLVNPFGDDPFFQQFFGDGFNFFGTPQLQQKGQQERQTGAGSGFIVSSDGLIVTNKHVVSDTDASYTVILNDGTKYDATVLARDPSNDIAIVKIDVKDLPTLALGDSTDIQLGQTVIAIGNALGEFSNTVTRGIVSGLSRSVVTGDAQGRDVSNLVGLIQTDAAVNQGNSGGPLLNLKGEVIGMNSAIAQAAEGIGFSIPINDIKRDIDQVKTDGKITVAFLGVRYIAINADLKERNSLSVDYGVLVQRGEASGDLAVMPGSPADKAGIVENDIILEVDGEKITDKNPLAQIVQRHKPGDRIKLKILHRGDEKIVDVVLNERK